MTIDHLEERVKDYSLSINKVLEKKQRWRSTTKDLLVNTLKAIEEKYKIGWVVQELNWMFYNESVNLTFKELPGSILNSSGQIKEGDFITGGSLVFSQAQNGDVVVFILFPQVENLVVDKNSMDLGTYRPETVTERLIIEKVDEFLKEMIRWEVPAQDHKIGFMSG
ncbi:hypothetical protein E7Z59_12465 [Robertkochia marina]|uniref:Uncharacterized protein n=1 Tax=Robertkochia marina TaxID=1227945 RepID=A0A4S3LYD6_9FLAO|nr:hypothetical protein [Robertkochia marina]THD66599.1 hypothetical protein E7Z59_12465 [Robertkochia marina]TRZ45562.1 hypothetical protein D3A96_06165 [Robertkochia marina]